MLEAWDKAKDGWRSSRKGLSVGSTGDGSWDGGPAGEVATGILLQNWG